MTAPGIHQTPSGHWVVDGDSAISAWIAEKGTFRWDSSPYLVLRHILREGDTVWDVGANIGDTTRDFLDLVGPAGKVVAIEPHHAAFECLARNCPEQHCTRLRIAADREVGIANVNHVGHNVGASFCSWDEPRQPTGWIVPAMPLDLLHLPAPDVIKLDVEGFEVRAIQGMPSAMRYCRALYCEVCDGHLRRAGSSADTLLDLLRAEFESVTIVQQEANWQFAQFDVLCTR